MNRNKKLLLFLLVLTLCHMKIWQHRSTNIRSLQAQTPVIKNTKTDTRRDMPKIHQGDTDGVCSQARRWQQIHSTCPPESSHDKMEEWLTSLSEAQLKSIFRWWFVDEKHKVLACLHFKVGSTTWIHLLANNSSPQAYRQNLTLHGNKWMKTLPPLGVYNFHDSRYSKDDIIKRLKNYYKFMVVRHPLERLLSFYRDKLIPEVTPYRHMKKRILSKTKLPQHITQQGRGVYFQDFIQYVIDGYTNEHWDGPYNTQCQPCYIEFDKIVKLETNDEDVREIIMDRLEGRGFTTKVNTHSNAANGEQPFSKLIPEYDNVTDTQLKAIVKKYKLDFEQFGYGYKRLNHSLQTFCSTSDTDGHVCC